MRILIGVHHFPPGYKGGAEWRAFRTATALLARGHSVQVFSIERIDSDQPGLTWRDEVYEGIPIRRLAFNIVDAPDRFMMHYRNPLIAEHLELLNSEFKPDVFHLIGGYLLSGAVLGAARRMSIPTVVSLTDYWYMCARISMLRSNDEVCDLPFEGAKCARCLGEEQRRFRYAGQVAPGLMDLYWKNRTRRVGQIEERYAYLIETLNQVDAILAPSHFLREMYVRAGIDPQRIQYSRQGNAYAGITADRYEKSPAGQLRLGYLGQIEPLKGLHVLLEAVRGLPGAALSLDLHGDYTRNQAYTARLKKIASEDPRIRFRGAYLRDELSQVLRDLDVIVFPSVWYENSPNAILEAFAHHTPVIASRLGGSSELIEDGVDGLLFTSNDAGDLSAKINRLLVEQGLLVTLKAGVKPVKSVEQEIQELMQTYQKITGGAGHALPG